MTFLINQAKEKYALGELPAALTILRPLLQAEPDNADAHFLAGMIHEELNQPQTAGEIFLKAIDLVPQKRRDVGFRAASNFLAAGNHSKALETMQRLIKHMPQDADVNFTLCSILREAGRYQEALPFADTLAAQGQGFQAWLNAGIIFSGAGFYEKAYPLLAKAYAEKPDERLALSEYFWCAANVCDLKTSDRLQTQLLKAYAQDGARPDTRESGFRALMWSGDEAYLALTGARTAAALFGKPTQSPPHSRNARRPGRWRIGYVSSDFYDHATMSLLAGVLEAHDRSTFEIFGFCHTEQQNRKGPMRRRFLKSCENMIDILDVPDDLVCQAVRELDIDILVDLKGFTQGSRLGIFRAHPAPVQITWLGFPGTVPGAGFDYAITDRFVTPSGSDLHFEEKMLRMPVSYQCNDSSREPVARTGSRADHGLPEHAIVFSSFNQAAKIRTPVVAAWMQILKQVNNSVLWIGQLNSLAQTHLRQAAVENGVDPARLIFAQTVSMADHLRRLPQADIALDTAPCNGHTTTSDALWAGVPVVTVKGTSFAGRVSESLLNAIGLPQLVTGDLDAYVALATQMAQTPQMITDLRDHLIAARKTSPLFDSQKFARDLEDLYRSVIAQS